MNNAMKLEVETFTDNTRDVQNDIAISAIVLGAILPLDSLAEGKFTVYRYGTGDAISVVAKCYDGLTWLFDFTRQFDRWIFVDSFPLFNTDINISTT